MGLSPTEVFSQATVSTPNEIGQATFVEGIIVTNFVGTTYINREGFAPCSQNCNHVYDFRINRDLHDPATVDLARDLLLKKGYTNLSDFRVFLRDFRTQALTEITMTTQVKTKDSVVFIEKPVLVSQSPFTAGCSVDSGPLERVKQRLAAGPEILPSRFIWP